MFCAVLTGQLGNLDKGFVYSEEHSTVMHIRGVFSVYKLTRLQPHWGEEGQRLVGTPRSGWQHHLALSSCSCSPVQVWPIPQPKGDELHPLLISNQGKQSATSHVSASSAHSPSPASSPIPPAHGVCHKQAQDVSDFAPGATALDVLFPRSLRHFLFPQQPCYRIAR